MGKTTFTRPKTHSRSAAHGNKWELQRTLETLDQRTSDLENRNGGNTISLVKSSPISTPPSQANVNVMAVPGSGRFVLRITNPQFKVRNRSNSPNTPIYHHIEFADNPGFKNSTSLPIGVQTYYEVGQFGSTKMHVRVKSSFDQQNFNLPVTKGPFTS